MYANYIQGGKRQYSWFEDSLNNSNGIMQRGI